MVRVGFWQAPDVKPAPSITNEVRDLVDLLELVQHRRLRILAHACDADLVDPVAGHAVGDGVGTDVLRARRIHHLRAPTPPCP